MQQWLITQSFLHFLFFRFLQQGGEKTREKATIISQRKQHMDEEVLPLKTRSNDFNSYFLFQMVIVRLAKFCCSTRPFVKILLAGPPRVSHVGGWPESKGIHP